MLKNYSNLAILKKNIGQIDSTLYYYLAALRISEKSSNPYWESPILKEVAQLYYISGNNQMALSYLYKALPKSKNINSYLYAYRISKLLNQVHFENGQFDSAYHYISMQNDFKDSILKNNNSLKYAELKYQMETEMNKEKISARYQRRLFLLMLVFVFLVMMIIIMSMYGAKQNIKIRNTLLEKENLANKMELKNKELAVNILATQKKNEMLGSIIKNIEDRMDLFPGKSRDVIGQFVKNLKNVEDDKGWEDFELVFSQVHESFFTRLDEFCPALSLKERRLCALLRLKMSSKQIAEVTQMTPQSVDTARYRLRKKFGIENPAIDLVRFLKNL
nr:hypothetical protein [Bacteroidota bacterium]